MFNQLSRSVKLIIRNGGLVGRTLSSTISKNAQSPHKLEVWLAQNQTRALYIQSQQGINHLKLSHQYKSSSACMSYDSSNKTHIKIHDLVTKGKKRVFVFMKGVPSQPLCGFSNAVVQILNAYGVEYDSCDVLDDQDIREQIKTYSDWPTIPQVYVDGNFIGGCDILIEMHQKGELVKMFADGSKKDEQEPKK